MKKYRTWYGIFFKEQLKKVSFYAELVVLVAVILFGANCHVVTKPITKVGYCYINSQDTKTGKQTYETKGVQDQKTDLNDIHQKSKETDLTGTYQELEKTDFTATCNQRTKDWLGEELDTSRVLSYVLFENEDTLKKALMMGEIDTGFLLPQYYDPDFSLVCMTSPYSTKDALARQHVYTVWYRYVSEQVILEADQEFYGNQDKQREEALLKANEMILEGQQVFQMEYVELSDETSKNTSQNNHQSVEEQATTNALEQASSSALEQATTKAEKVDATVFPMQGLTGIFLMLMMFFHYKKRFQKDFKGVYQVLLGLDREGFMAVYELAGMTPMVLVALMTLLATGKSSGFVRELLGLLVLFMLTLLFLLIFGRLFRKEESFRVFMVLFLVLQILICPVFADVCAKLPILVYLKNATPLGIYLCIVG